MIHYSCDRCRRALGQHEIRYVMRMEVQEATEDTIDMDADSDRDHLLEVHEILESLDDRDELEDPHYTRKSFDLCSECRDAVLANPLGKAKSMHNLPFSAN